MAAMPTPASTAAPTRLARDRWHAAAAAHAGAVEALTAGHRARRAKGEQHPVEDFLFTYYRHSPAQLARWHPGVGVVLEDAADAPHAGWRHYEVVGDDVRVDVPGFLARRDRTVRHVVELVAATLSRPAQLGCLGMHEWAMVYRLPDGARRHEQLPLRLGRAATDAVVEAHPLRCTHHDAFRFFTADAVGRSPLRPRREDQVALEQPGCLHAGMDVYKWCHKLTPLVPSDLTLDAFRLAGEIRALDMQASPHDVSGLGLAPVPVETAAGRAEYVARQRDFTRRSNVLRRRLLDVLADVGMHPVAGRDPQPATG